MKTKISALQLYLMLFLSRVIVSITINVQTVGGSNLIESIFSSLGLFLYLTVFSLPLSCCTKATRKHRFCKSQRITAAAVFLYRCPQFTRFIL